MIFTILYTLPWLQTWGAGVPMFSKAPSSADQARSKGIGGGQQHEPVQPSAKVPVSHCYPSVPFIDAIQAFLLIHTDGFFDGK